MLENHEHLVEAVRRREVILFVGAGVSRNLGLPGWEELVSEMAQQLGFDPQVFKMYGDGDNLRLSEYYLIQRRSVGALRSWMDRIWHTDEPRVDKSVVHQLIVDLNFPLVYTTNYDRWLEIAYKRRGRDFVKVAHVGDFPRAVGDKPQIVKFHGDLESDESLVVGESDYFERLSFESPLDIKLRADSIGRALLFIGYSLSDINIRYMLYKLHRLWASSPHADDRPRSYIVLGRPNIVDEEILRKRRGITPLICVDDDPRVGLTQFLADLKWRVDQGNVLP